MRNLKLKNSEARGVVLSDAYRNYKFNTKYIRSFEQGKIYSMKVTRL